LTSRTTKEPDMGTVPHQSDDDRLAVSTLSSPVGVLTLAASDAGLRYVLWEADGRDDLTARIAAPGSASASPGAVAVLADAVAQLGEYFDGVRTEFDLPLDAQGTPFQRSAWTALCTIPFGETVSYGEQARRLGDARKARAVGAANGRNPISIVVPCHRVVGSNGSLTGFAAGLDAKAWLLDHERRVLVTSR
jgi:methylated-DNA-[protein]-cysteine S-methyltransferase